MIYIGILIGALGMSLVFIGLLAWANHGNRKQMVDYQERCLAALERRNEIGEEMADAIRRSHENRKP